jgi:ribokinase
MDIVVFGSINMDLVARAPRLPVAGETLTGRSFHTAPGGKGANQAVACARLGVRAAMVGRVGDDPFGVTLRQGLQAAGVDTTWVLTTPGTSSGVALITVDDTAENSIVVVHGANSSVGPADLKGLTEALDGAKLLLLQLEIPLEMVEAATRMARERNVTVILDPAPARELPGSIYPLVDILTPNGTEAAALTGLAVEDASSAARVAEELLARGCGRVIIKMGSQGVYVADLAGGRLLPAIPVEAVDTVAAGDAFNGALAAALSQGLPFDTALRWGLGGGALAVTRAGAQEAMPSHAELSTFLNGQ